jgi:hypothetical protein
MALVVEIDEQLLAAKFGPLPPHLDERQRWRRRRGRWGQWDQHGCAAAGVSRKTVVAGVDLGTGVDLGKSLGQDPAKWGRS